MKWRSIFSSRRSRRSRRPLGGGSPRSMPRVRPSMPLRLDPTASMLLAGALVDRDDRRLGQHDPRPRRIRRNCRARSTAMSRPPNPRMWSNEPKVRVVLKVRARHGQDIGNHGKKISREQTETSSATGNPTTVGVSARKTLSGHDSPRPWIAIAARAGLCHSPSSTLGVDWSGVQAEKRTTVDACRVISRSSVRRVSPEQTTCLAPGQAVEHRARVVGVGRLPSTSSSITTPVSTPGSLRPPAARTTERACRASAPRTSSLGAAGSGARRSRLDDADRVGRAASGSPAAAASAMRSTSGIADPAARPVTAAGLVRYSIL